MKKLKENKLVVGDGNWAESLPDWLLEKVKEERIILGLMSIVNPDIEKIGDAEVLTYLLPATLRAPLPTVLYNIYLYLAGKICDRSNKEFPSDIRIEELSKSEERELQNLKDMIYHKRGGEINHPILNLIRQFKKQIVKQEPKSQRTLLFDFLKGDTE